MIENKIFLVFEKITNYKIVFGGIDYPLDVHKGVCLINFIRATPLTSDFKDFSIINEDKINSFSIIKYDFQVDFLKVNKKNINFIEANTEAVNFQELLKSYSVQDDLKNFDLEIFPNYSTVNFITEYSEQKKLINRAFFDLSIIKKVYNVENVNLVDKVKIQSIKGL